MLLVRVFIFLVFVLLMGVVQISPIFASPQANTYIVDTHESGPDHNPGDGICQTPSWLDACTLQAAVEESNADGVSSIIKFSSPFTGGQSINSRHVPSLTEGYTTIDAREQWDTADNRPGVEISGLTINSNWNEVYGVSFGATDGGIHIKSSNSNTIGGSVEGQRNVFTSEIGVKISGNSRDNRIRYNYFGTFDADWAVPGMKKGIEIQNGKENLIELNVIAGADEYGIILWISADENVIRKNSFGTNLTGQTPIKGNKTGIRIDFSHRNQIGPDNLIYNSKQDGLYIIHSDYTIVDYNDIGGPTSYGHSETGRYGIYSFSSDNVLISENSVRNTKEHGLYINSGKDIQILGNGFHFNNKDGVYILDAKNVLIDGNGMSGNGANGLRLSGSYNSGTLVINNDIGHGYLGRNAGNAGNGVVIEAGAHSNTIGGYGENEANWIGWNGLMGVLINGSTTHSNKVHGNVIGAPFYWDEAAPNGQHGVGIYNGAHDNSIGTLFVGNFIVGNKWSGIGIDKSDDNTILFNFIGTDGSDKNMKNNGYGVHIVDSKGNQTIANEIAFHNNGVVVSGSSASGNLISMNSIHDHLSTGIELLNGGNNSIDFPVLTAASCDGPVTGKACPGCQVEIFSDDDGEGRIYEGSVVADSSGNFYWAGKPNGPEITATNTDLVDNTSNFSLGGWGLDPPCNLPPEAKFTHSPKKGSVCTLFKFDASGSSDPDDPKSALKVRWDFDNNNVYETDWSKTKTVTRVLRSPTLDFPTVQTVRMQVMDANGLTDTITKQIEIEGNCDYTQLPLIFK